MFLPYLGTITVHLWKSGRVADCVCLENRFTFTGDGGSNPSSSELYSGKINLDA